MSNLDDQLEARLTQRARELLANLLEDLREEILTSASRRGVSAEIGARDIIEAFEEHTGRSRVVGYDSARRRQRLQFLLASYAVTAAVLALLAVTLSLTDLQSSNVLTLVASISVALVGASLGLLLAARTRAAAAAQREIEEMRRQDRFADFLERWLRVESLLRLLVARDLGASSAELPLGALLDAGSRAGRISASEYEELRNLLSVRNSGVHEGALDRESLVNASQIADRLILRFEDELAS